jgi:hypothetical protein
MATMTNLLRAAARAVPASLALTLVLVACSDDEPVAAPSTAVHDDGDTAATSTIVPDAPGTAGSGETPAATGDDAEPATTGIPNDDGGDDGSGKELWRGPLDEFLGFGADQRSAEEIESDHAKARQVEDLIAACMSEQGFDYVARDPSDESLFESGPWSLPPDEFARQYGYGISTIDESNNGQSSDPNQQIVEGMGSAERRAYFQALYGDAIAVDDDGNITKRGPATDVAEPQMNDSCSATASATVYGDSSDESRDDPAADPFAALEQEMSALYERVSSDQRVVDATAAWSSCLADAGFPGYSEPTDPVVDVDSRASEVMGDRRDPSTADPAELEELRTFEVAVATADYECRVPLDDVQHAVQTELEQQFIDEHRAELEQFRDAMAAGEVGKG